MSRREENKRSPRLRVQYMTNGVNHIVWKTKRDQVTCPNPDDSDNTFAEVSMSVIKNPPSNITINAANGLSRGIYENR